MNSERRLETARVADFEQFLTYLFRATAEISSQYMLLPIDGSALPIYRERVYCYELYHQLRKQMGNEWYALGGEVDKSNHPRMNHPSIRKTKPDLLVHRPGYMSGNLVIIEIKPVAKSIRRGQLTIPPLAAIKKDLKTLTAFRQHGEYSRAIYLIYGDDSTALAKIKRRARDMQNSDDSVNLDLIDLYWHQAPGFGVRHEPWLA